MSSFFDKMRSGAGKAAFEADRLRRVTAAQSELRRLRDEMNRAVNLVGRVAFDLHQRGQAGPPELSAACDTAAAVLAQVSAQEAEIERIRNEQYVEPATAAYDPSPLVCPAGHGPLTPGARFCQQCGQPGVPPAAAPAIPCPTCGTPLQTDARFCFNCGQPMTPLPPPKLAPPAPAPPAPTDPTQPETVRLDSTKPTKLACPSCGEPVLSDTEAYCATCGYPLKRAT